MGRGGFRTTQCSVGAQGYWIWKIFEIGITGLNDTLAYPYGLLLISLFSPFFFQKFGCFHLHLLST